MYTCDCVQRCHHMYGGPAPSSTFGGSALCRTADSHIGRATRVLPSRTTATAGQRRWGTSPPYVSWGISVDRSPDQLQAHACMGKYSGRFRPVCMHHAAARGHGGAGMYWPGCPGRCVAAALRLVNKSLRDHLGRRPCAPHWTPVSQQWRWPAQRSAQCGRGATLKCTTGVSGVLSGSERHFELALATPAGLTGDAGGADSRQTPLPAP